MNERPNILIITTDQQRWDALSLWGTAGYRTPNLDRLGTEGVIFDRAYCAAPVCTPARVSMITGQYSTRHGAYTIGMEAVPALDGPTIGSIFSDHGYATAVIGKTHYVARRIEDQHVAGCDLDAPCPEIDFWDEFDGPYCGFQHVRHNRRHNADGEPNAHYRAWLRRAGANLEALDSLHGHGERRPTSGAWDIDPDKTQNAWILNETLSWIDDRRSPWLAMANFQDPHFPYVCPEPYYSAVDMNNVDLGGVIEGEMADKPPYYQRFLDGKYFTDADDKHFWDGINFPAMGLHEQHPQAASDIRAYIGMCNMVDDYVGRLLDGLEQRGLADNTLIIFTSDHGDQLGRHGIWGKGLCAYDDHQRIPALMRWPAAQQSRIGHNASHFNHVDILPTCCDAAGIPVPTFVQGISQLPVLRGEQTSVRDWAIVDFLATRNVRPEIDTVDIHQVTFIHDEWKLVVYRHADYGELYNLTDDPDQRVNCWNSHPERKLALMQRLLQADMERSGVMPLRISAS